MRNAELGMRNEGKALRRIVTLTPSNTSYFSIQHSAFLILFLLALFLSPALTAANDYDIFYNPYAVEPDTTKVIYPIPVSTGNPIEDLHNQSPLYLSDPDNFTTEIIYDPLTGQYTFKRRIGEFYYDTPTTLTQSEYFEYQNKKGIQQYWKERRSQNARSTTNGNSIIPPIYVGGKAFETIFGSNTIDIRPQGSVDLTFGFKHSYRDDPSLSERRKKHNDFIFEQDIQLNVMAKIGDKINFNINKNTKATFNYQDKLALKYEGKEDEIIQLLEAGNVSFPLNSTLITGTQQLFGIKRQPPLLPEPVLPRPIRSRFSHTAYGDLKRQHHQNRSVDHQHQHFDAKHT